MATTTTNFGWDIPQSTDLVKDGATAIAALGQDIDTALVDLKGGTTGQVLAKATNTDLDFSWVAQDDSNAIQNSIVDAKGDLISATANDTPARLGVGTNGQVLTADSSAATGLAWATPSGGNFVGAYAYLTTSPISAANAGYTFVAFNAEDFDTNSFHDNSTNSQRFTVPAGKAGKYLITTGIALAPNTTEYRILQIAKNAATAGGGTELCRATINGFATQDNCLNASVTADLAVGDYITISIYQNSGGSLNINTGRITNATITYLGA
jgi:hypothetical protein